MLFQSKNTHDTLRFGKRMRKRLQRGDVVALVGELGAGKTHLIKGLAAGVRGGSPEDISSPSYTLIHEYPGEIPFYHIDLYRLEIETEAEDLGLDEYFQSQGVTAVEWADKIPSFLPEEVIWIHVCCTGEHSRSIQVTPRGKRYEALLKELGG